MMMVRGRMIPWGYTAALALAVTTGALVGCSNHSAELDDPPMPRRTVAAAREVRPPERIDRRVEAEPLPPPTPSRPDPRNFKTPDGKPAPYGRDPVTGRPVAVVTDPAAYDETRAPVADGGSTIVVGKGETLDSIARRFNVDIESIKRANGLASEHVRVGQRLMIPDA